MDYKILNLREILLKQKNIDPRKLAVLRDRAVRIEDKEMLSILDEVAKKTASIETPESE